MNFDEMSTQDDEYEMLIYPSGAEPLSLLCRIQ